MAIQIVPMLGIARYAGIEPKVFIRVGIDTLAVGGFGTGMLAGTHSAGTDLLRLVTDPLETQGTVFTARFAEIGKRRAVNRTDRSAGGVEAAGGRFGISHIQRYAGTLKSEVVFERGINVIGVKGSVAEEGLVGETRMSIEVVGENGL